MSTMFLYVTSSALVSSFLFTSPHSFSSFLLFLSRAEPLGPPSPVSFYSITTESVTLAVRLPSTGSPPILSLSVSLISSTHNHTLLITDQLYSLGEELVLFINETSRGGIALMSGTTYNVTVLAGNLLGWSQYASPAVSFTTGEYAMLFYF